MHTAAKKSALLRLARGRQTDTLDGYSRKYFHFRDFDCDCEYVVPWTISACNVNADLMLIAQDWASEDFLNGLNDDQRQTQRALGQFPDLPTNLKTQDLLTEHMSISFRETYATDAFAFVKSGKMNARIPFRDLVRSAATYALPQIAIVRPKMVVCLGSASFNAVRRAIITNGSERPGNTKLKRMPLADAWRIEEPYHTEYLGIPVFGVAHPGANGTRASGGPEVTTPRWHTLGNFFRAIRDQRRSAGATFNKVYATYSLATKLS
jgi:restriction system protein